MAKTSKASFNVDSQTLNNFRVSVAQKYGRLYGVLEKEFTQALNERIVELKKEKKVDATSLASTTAPTSNPHPEEQITIDK